MLYNNVSANFAEQLDDNIYKLYMTYTTNVTVHVNASLNWSQNKQVTTNEENIYTDAVHFKKGGQKPLSVGPSSRSSCFM